LTLSQSHVLRIVERGGKDMEASRKQNIGNKRLVEVGELAAALAESIRHTELDYSSVLIQTAMKALRDHLDKVIDKRRTP